MVYKLQKLNELVQTIKNHSKIIIKNVKDFYTEKEFDKKLKNFLRNGLSFKQTAIMSSILIIGIIIILIPQPQSIKSPIGVIKNIEIAINKSDIKAFSNLVDIKSCTDQISSNILLTEKNALNKKLLEDVKSELNKKIIQDLFNIIEEKGNFQDNINNKDAILSKILNVIFGKNGAIIGLNVIDETKETAKVAIKIFRPDLSENIVIVLILQKTQADTWQVKGIDNIKELLAKLNKLEKQKLEKLNSKENKDLTQYIELKAFKIEKVDAKNNTLIFRTVLENKSRHSLENIKGKIYILYNENTIGSINISISDKIRPFSFLEKAWSIKLEKNNLLLRNIAKIKPSNLSAEIEVKSAYFSK